jgi:hypothetical protein
VQGNRKHGFAEKNELNWNLYQVSPAEKILMWTIKVWGIDSHDRQDRWLVEIGDFFGWLAVLFCIKARFVEGTAGLSLTCFRFLFLQKLICSSILRVNWIITAIYEKDVPKPVSCWRFLSYIWRWFQSIKWKRYFQVANRINKQVHESVSTSGQSIHNQRTHPESTRIHNNKIKSIATTYV